MLFDDTPPTKDNALRHPHISSYHTESGPGLNKILVTKETVVLRRWEIETEIDFIKGVDKRRITTVKDLES